MRMTDLRLRKDDSNVSESFIEDDVVHAYLVLEFCLEVKYRGKLSEGNLQIRRFPVILMNLECKRSWCIFSLQNRTG